MSRYECEGDVCRLIVKNNEPVEEMDPLPMPSKGKFTIYGTKRCGFCKNAKSVLRMGPYNWEFINVDDYRGGRQQIVSRSSHKTVPVIYDSGRFIGGYTELLVHLSP